VSGLFSRDFFEMAKGKLAPGGRLVQWIHTYESSVSLVKLVVRTLRGSFEHGTTWVGPDDLALAQAAAGGDLLFLEACLRRGVRCQVLLPFPEAEFIARSILQSINAAHWHDRYDAIREGLRQQVEVAPLRIMSEALGPTPEGQNPFERCNLWLLNSALALGIERVRFLALWDGGGGDGPGGTAHMVAEIQRHSGQILIIDPRSL
jgi:hypothetical protein